MPDFALQRRNMMEAQVQSSDVSDDRLLNAMGQVRRERFMPAARHALAYADTPVEVASGRFLLDPRSFAKLAQLAAITAEDRVLDVGPATGYSSAVFSLMAHRVIALEQDGELVRLASDSLYAVGARNVTVVQGALSGGHKAQAPYDVIYLNGTIAVPPKALLAQLAPGGRLVGVVRQNGHGRACLFRRENGRISQWDNFDATVPELPGFSDPVGFVF